MKKLTLFNVGTLRTRQATINTRIKLLCLYPRTTRETVLDDYKRQQPLDVSNEGGLTVLVQSVDLADENYKMQHSPKIETIKKHAADMHTL